MRGQHKSQEDLRLSEIMEDFLEVLMLNLEKEVSLEKGVRVG